MLSLAQKAASAIAIQLAPSLMHRCLNLLGNTFSALGRLFCPDAVERLFRRQLIIAALQVMQSAIEPKQTVNSKLIGHIYQRILSRWAERVKKRQHSF